MKASEIREMNSEALTKKRKVIVNENSGYKRPFNAGT